ncbi:uncharacterized protein M421DRAFT_372256 [Didymella exigua CBS 183.55]|uniref:Uncharacterized protein n=1 Tax=Didymella exigua CBS 183.55 TaxID=1150837 RepID=A0A6A5RVQ0_9PLEO|nr:uncharacterized protein M421DRAFT_372256 [Didymella exigua CBS 183.55]KAF1930356.1 hypothetical protein M421DRAFT_372256 [Didymella exigua CBS 183.55]
MIFKCSYTRQNLSDEPSPPVPRSRAYTPGAVKLLHRLQDSRTSTLNTSPYRGCANGIRLRAKLDNGTARTMRLCAACRDRPQAIASDMMYLPLAPYVIACERCWIRLFDSSLSITLTADGNQSIYVEKFSAFQETLHFSGRSFIFLDRSGGGRPTSLLPQI